MKPFILALLLSFVAVHAQQPTAIANANDSLHIVSVEMYGTDYPCIQVTYKNIYKNEYHRDYYFPDSGDFAPGFKWKKKYVEYGKMVMKESIEWVIGYEPEKDDQ